jgi:cytochrome c peroxidase
MNWKVGSLIVAALLLLGAQGQVEGAPPASRGAALADYQRPAAIPFPDGDPYSAAKDALGRRLFFDPVFSNSRTISCATCHNPALSWGDGRPRAHGEGANDLAYRSPTLLDVAWMPRLGWDGKFRDLESVAFAPITASGNMNLKEEALIARLAAEPSFVAAFADAFPEGGVSRGNIEQALATYERGIVSPEAPFDRWARGDESAIDETPKRAAPVAIAAGRSATARFTISARPRARISDAEGCFRLPSSCNTPSRRRRCGTRRNARPICTTVPCRPWKQ